ncbi:hypothetical protein ACA910_018931 [Epithemia clementina (nom. ined.)]
MSSSSSSSSLSSTRLFASSSSNNNNNQKNKKKKAVIAGATGYIGKAVVQESVRQGYETYALVRDLSKVQSTHGKALYAKAFQGAHVVECNVGNLDEVTQILQRISTSRSSSRSRTQQSSWLEHHDNDDNDNNNNDDDESFNQIDLIVSCLASRSGIKKEAYAIDYQATLHCLEAGRACRSRHFVLLSAFCVRNPWLQFQQAKLKFEAALQQQSDMTWTIVRPTAFFKSVSGQLESVQSGAPYILFGDGQVTRCNPIAELDLARYMVDSAQEPSRCNQIINLGGPDEPLTMRQQGEMIFRALGGQQEPYFVHAPLWMFDVIIDSLQWLADTFQSEALENAAETGRIGKYYAVEDMLTTDPKEKYGTITLQEHYNRIAVEGQEYDAVMRRGSIVRTIFGQVGRWTHKLYAPWQQATAKTNTAPQQLRRTTTTTTTTGAAPAAAYNTTRI